MEQILRKTERIISKQSKSNLLYTPGEKHTEYQKTYFSTNECVDSYLNIFDITSKNTALCVTASGDQIFNLITKGIYNIDTFDSNRLSEYLALGLKRAMILKYSYHEYLDVVEKICYPKNILSPEEARTIIFDLLPYMDEKYRIYWKKVIDMDCDIQNKNGSRFDLFHLIYFSFSTVCELTRFNSYMLNEEEYNKLKNGILKANITFTYGNAINLDTIFKNRKYDLILLSNILDYFYKSYGNNWEYSKLIKYISKLEKIANHDGIIFLNYIFHLEYYLETDLTDQECNHIKLDSTYGNFRIIGNSNVRFRNLVDEEIYLLKDPEKSINDGILLKRVQK